MPMNEEETKYELINPVLREKGYRMPYIKLETPAPVEPIGPKGRRRSGPGRTVCSFEGWTSVSNLAGEGIAAANEGAVESSPAIRRQCSCLAISVACRPSSFVASS